MNFFSFFNYLNREVFTQDASYLPDTMIRDNTVAILGWIQCEKVKWLQNNNPEVPGLIYKLAPLDEKMRKLSHVRKLWDGILDLRSIVDVFTNEPIDEEKYVKKVGQRFLG